MEIGNRAVGVTVEGHKRVDKIPDIFIRGMEDVCAVFMDVDALDVSAQMRTLVNNKAALTGLLRLVCKCCSEETGADYQIIVMGHFIIILKVMSCKKEVSLFLLGEKNLWL